MDGRPDPETPPAAADPDDRTADVTDAPPTGPPSAGTPAPTPADPTPADAADATPPDATPDAAADGSAPVQPAIPLSPAEVDFQALVATRAQVRSSWAATVVGVVALLVSLVAWISQWQLNSQQAKLNDRAIAQSDQAYAADVSVWAVTGEDVNSGLPAGLDTSVQNRSPVPVFDVRLAVTVLAGSGQPTDAVTTVEVVPPCTLLTFRLVAPEDTRFGPPGSARSAALSLELVFTETGRLWLLHRGQLSLDADRAHVIDGRAGSMRRLRLFRQKSADIGNC